MNVGPWNLSDLKDVKKNGLKTFSFFACGGGSTMGYKLAGYDVIGHCDIDPNMIKIYKQNHKPKYSFPIGIKDFNIIPDTELPKELFDLDVLDGSPPCSSFSMAGSREKKWGKETKFREGQTVQRLDDLFFDFIDSVEKLGPKVVIGENVKGMLAGNARGYVSLIFDRFDDIGYDIQLFLLNSSRMGVPQRRERVFFVARKKSLNWSNLVLEFNEEPIGVGDAIKGAEELVPLSEAFAKWWRLCPPGKSFSKVHPKGSFFNSMKLHPEMPSPTVTASGGAVLTHWEKCSKLDGRSIARLQTFPDDYDFLDLKAKYICGMSVPPFMMQRVANQVAKQWFNK